MVDLVTHTESQIVDTRYFYDGTLTICVITTVNGFKVVGKSDVVDASRYDRILGMKYSQKDAFDKLVEILSYQFKNHS